MQPARKPRCRIGIDVGGTFTDLVLIDPQASRITYFKEPSTPEEPSLAVERGVLGVMERAQVGPSDIELVVHGTTLGLNTIIQRKGARTALVVSRGNRDVLEMARIRMPSPFDLFGRRDEPLVPRELVYEINARVRVDGTVECRPPPNEIDALAETLRKTGVSAVAVMLMNSYRHAALELDIADGLRSRLPGVLVSASAQVWPEIREYERTLIATLSAYIHPQIDAYYTRLQDRMHAIGIRSPIFITTNNGGTIGLSTAREHPIETVLSGPASGVVAGCHIASLCDVRQFITVDMGGTSSDMAVTIGDRPEYSTQTLVGEFPFMLPVVNVSAIGAGGGSIVWVDAQGILKVGPHSAGADPGPICYRRGGSEPTITDCYLVLGWLRSDGFLGGRMPLDLAAATEALETIGRRIGITGVDAAQRTAEAALRVATAKMATEVHRGFAQRGLDPRDFALIAYGGAGPTHACLLAEEVRLDKFIIPVSPGTLCALGAIVSDLKRDFVRTVRRIVADALVPGLDHLAFDLRKEAADWLELEGSVAKHATMHWSAEMRYVREGIGLTVDVADKIIEQVDLEKLQEAFHVAHDIVYGFHDPDAEIELLTLRLQAVSPASEVTLPKPASTSGAPPSSGQRRCFVSGGWVNAKIHHRNDVLPGHVIDGPALIEQEDTTLLLLDSWRGRVNDSGVVEATRIPA